MLHQPGDILGGKYRIERFLGAGAFGEVYLATHLKLEARRALKLLSRSQSGLASTEISDFRDRFTLEAQLGARLKHDRLVQVFDFEEIGDELLLVMEFAAGGSLADRMRALKQSEQIMPVSEVERIALETAEGLAAIHALDVVHRDLKPANLLLDGQGHVKIADLGLAQVPGGLSSRSQLASLARSHPGTPAYMSPEQETSSGYLRPASDVYSLGIILFELLTGRNIKNLEPGTRAKSLRAEVPDWLDELLAHMLADDPRQRPWNGEKVAGLLHGGLAQETARKEAAEKARLEEEERQRLVAETARLEAEARARQAAAEKTRLAEEERQRQVAETARLASERRVKLEAEEKTLHEAEVNAARMAAARQAVKEKGQQAVNAVPKLRQKHQSGWAWAAIAFVGLIGLIWIVGKLSSPKPQATVTATSTIAVAFVPSETLAMINTVLPTTTWTVTIAPPTQPPTLTLTPVNTVDPSLGIGSTKISSIDGMVLMFVPAGNFLMGSDKISDSPNTDTTDELPQHTVFLDAFWIDQTLVTNGMYARCFAAGSCTAPALTSSSTTRPDYYGNSLYADYPVIHVEWNQANAYCQWAGRQLPTEAQWEKAARGTDGRIYPWGNQAPDATRANFNNNVGDTTKVGSYPAGASPYGALDMAGNVWEFVLDWYSKTYYQQSPSSNPAGPSSGNRYVLRGGSLEDDGGLIRSAFRNNYPPHWGLPFFRGFRCAASP